jgi:predicted DNA-binding transcriptional regulator YafY
MGQLERVFFFHQQVTKGKYPNSGTISRQFEVSVITAKRDINYLRDRLLAPLSFNSRENGYFYQDGDFLLPFEQSPRIIFLLSVLGKLAEEAGLGDLQEVRQLEDRLQKMISTDYSRIVDLLQVEWIEVESIASQIFETVIEAVVKERLLSIDYRSVAGDKSNRRVAPQRILNYQGRWYLYGFCTLRQAGRLFHMGRIGEARITSEPPPPGLEFHQHKLDRSFGIFQGEPGYWAEILFRSTAAELVRHQYWHKDQQLEVAEDEVLLRLPVGDDRELIMKILQYGSMAEVISPPELVERVTAEIAAMGAIYDQKLM